MSEILRATISVPSVTPLGGIQLDVRDDFLLDVQYLETPVQQNIPNHPFMHDLADQVHRYFAGKLHQLDVPMILQGTDFQKRVWRTIAEIPYGHTWTYAELADHVRSGPRAVANVCGANRIPLFIPCHRVVAKQGLGGFMQGRPGGLEIKSWLLAHEAMH